METVFVLEAGINESCELILRREVFVIWLLNARRKHNAANRSSRKKLGGSFG